MGKRIDEYRDRKKRRSVLEDIKARQANGQARGDLGSPDKNSPRYNYNTYKEDHFSGSQAKIYFGDIWVDDIVTVQYSISQSKQPIYGYASQNFDAISMGTVIGQGTLTVAFKEVGYLNVVKALLDQQRLGVGKAIQNVTNRLNSSRESELSSNIRTTTAVKGQVNPNFTPSLIRKSETIEDILDNLKGVDVNPWNNYSGYLGRNIFQGDSEQRDFEDVAEILEDSIWGDSNGTPFGSMSNKILRADEFDYYYEKFAAQGITNAHNDEEYTKVLNILLTFGDINDFRAEHTMVVLNDVHFQSEGMLVAPNGEPIAETYSFFFRDKNKSVTGTSFGESNPVKFFIGTDNPVDLSRLQDVERIEELLDSSSATVDVRILSNFENGKWSPTSLGFNADSPQYMDKPFIINYSKGAAASLNDYIEEAMSRFYVIRQNIVRPNKVVVAVTLTKASTGLPIVYNYVLEKQGNDTSVYKVISPSTDDFYSLNLVRREDFFSLVPAKEDKAPDPLAETYPLTDPFRSEPGSYVDPLAPGATVLNEDAKKLLQEGVSSVPLEIDLLPQTSEAEQLQQAIEDPTVSRIEKRRLEKQLEKEEAIDREIAQAEAELAKLPVDSYTEPDREIAAMSKAQQQLWYENRVSTPAPPDSTHFITVTEPPLEHEIYTDVHSTNAAIDVTFKEKETGKKVGPILPFQSQIIDSTSKSIVFRTPYQYGKESVQIQTRHYGTEEYNVGDIVPPRTPVGEYVPEKGSTGEHADIKFKLVNQTGTSRLATPEEVGYLFYIIYGPEFEIKVK